MRPRFSFAVCFLLLAVHAGAVTPPAIHYTLRFPDALHHYVHVEADIPTGGAGQIELFMPVWTPGSYLVREFARNLDHVTASATDGADLAVTKTAKNRWRVETGGQSSVRVSYRVYGWEISVRTNWIEADFAMIHGAATYLTVVDAYQRPYRVRVELPGGWAGSYTSLPAAGAPHTYAVPDFDTLVDSPLLAGSPQVDTLDIDGVRHVLVTLGGAGVWDNARAARNFGQIARTQKAFWGHAASTEPYYIFNLLTGHRGGLEHRQSFVMSADRWLSRTRSGINSWLSLVSHEYFHAWNGKRLRPIELGPFPYEHETYTRTLWVVEGVTSYYQHLLLRRAGFYTRQDYLKTLGGNIAGVERTPGRRVQSLSEASFDAWIKAYRPDENAVNTRLSYYSGGAVAAALLDAEIQRVSDGAATLDDVMRAAYARYSGERGYTEQDFITLLGETAGAGLSQWYADNIQSPGDWDYEPLLDWYGLRFETPEPPSTKMLPNGLEPPDPVRGWLGADSRTQDGRVVVTRVRRGTPAYAAGLWADDEIVAINGFRVGDSVDGLVRRYLPGDSVDVLVSRRGQLRTLPARLAEKPRDTWKIEVDPDATDAQKARLDAWLGEEPEEAAADSTAAPAEGPAADEADADSAAAPGAPSQGSEAKAQGDGS